MTLIEFVHIHSQGLGALSSFALIVFMICYLIKKGTESDR